MGRGRAKGGDGGLGEVRKDKVGERTKDLSKVQEGWRKAGYEGRGERSERGG